MCGLTAAMGPDADRVVGFVRRANLVQAHRGPDAVASQDFGFERCHVSLGHQRLSILDLSDAGTQPMASASGRFVIAFNGEIYNYLELKAQFGLAGLRSSSDTEVLLELIEKIGLERALREANGMWALVLLDRQERKVFLSRDRLGKKPLHWMEKDDSIFVASEAKSLVREIGPGFAVDGSAAFRYLTQSLQDIDERTWIQGIRSFPAAHFAAIDLSGPRPVMEAPRPYWRLEEAQVAGNFDEYVEQLAHVVGDSIRLRLRSDVPIGVALSGGLDSSIIATMVARHCDGSGSPIRFFSAVSPGRPEDESRFVGMMEAYTGTGVERVDLDARFAEDFDGVMEKATFHNDAPIASFSNVLFYLLMQRAWELGIKVIYSGQGADEAFCGYRKYPMFELRRLLRTGRWMEAFSFARPFVARGTVFSQFNFAEAKRYIGRPSRSIVGEAAAGHAGQPLGAFASMQGRQADDIRKYSVPYLTHYEDRMSMAWSREVRAPFLDYRVVEMGVHAPTSFKLRDGWTKYCLRRAFEDRLPLAIAWRKDKQGFVNPQDHWLKTRLAGQIEAMISDPQSPVFAEGLVDRAAYRTLFEKYRRGARGVWFRDAFAPFALDRWLRIYRAWA